MPKRNEASTINYLRSVAMAGESKYRRNGVKYTNSVDFSPSSTRMTSPLGWWFQDYSNSDDGTITPKVNVTKSVLDTYASKIASQKVIPLFTPKKGTLTTRKAVKACQTYFDDLFYECDANERITEAERYASIFDFGWTWANTWLKTVTTLAPWQIGIIGNEWQYRGYGTKALVTYRDYPCTQLSDYGISNDKDKTYCLFEIYYDIEAHVTKLYIDKKEVKSAKWNGKRVPFRAHYFNQPLLGYRTTSLLDDLLPIQEQIDINITKIKDAANSTPLNTIFVPDGTELDITALDTGAGNVLRYRPMPGVSEPVKVATPMPIDQFYLTWHEKLKSSAMEMAGISELSSQGLKPAGLDSGEALKTMENVESARFETQLNRVIHAYVDLAMLFIDSFDEDAEILPEDKMRDRITWKQLKKEIDNVNIQFTAASALSNDPQKQVELLQQLSQLGLIDQTRVAEMIDLPDAESAFDDTGAIPDAVEAVISAALDDDEYEIPIFLDYDALRDRIMIYQNKFFAMSGDHKEQVGRLQKLFLKLDELSGPPPEAAPQGQDAQGAGGAEGVPAVADPSKGFAAAQPFTPGDLASDGNTATRDLSQPGEVLPTGPPSPAQPQGAM